MYRILFFLFLPSVCLAQESATAFGDSITRGVGDFSGPESFVEFASTPVANQEAGYPLRIETFLEVAISNRGNPGEQVTDGAITRFVNELSRTPDNTILLSGGSNDSIFRVPAGQVFRALQTMINFAKVRGKEVILVNITPVCCDREDRESIIESYNDQYGALAALNNLRLADVFKGFLNTCGGVLDDCFLLSRPEGLHPNSVGYDVMGEVISAQLLGVDIFTLEGQGQFASAVGFAPTTIPDPTN